MIKWGRAELAWLRKDQEQGQLQGSQQQELGDWPFVLSDISASLISYLLSVFAQEPGRVEGESDWHSLDHRCMQGSERDYVWGLRDAAIFNPSKTL